MNIILILNNTNKNHIKEIKILTFIMLNDNNNYFYY